MEKSKDLSPSRKSLEILKALARRCEEGRDITIGQDWGYGSGTLIEKDGSHTHFGSDLGDNEAEQLDSFIDGLYNILVKNIGLSFVGPK